MVILVWNCILDYASFEYKSHTVMTWIYVNIRDTKIYELKFLSLFWRENEWMTLIWESIFHGNYEKAENEVHDCERRVGPKRGKIMTCLHMHTKCKQLLWRMKLPIYPSEVVVAR